jgi:hypothetical protein
MIQYKHASVAAFEGYAGTSASGFRAEVEAQRRLGQQGDLLDYFDRRQGGASLGGPAGPRIARTLDDAAVQLGPLPAMIADRSRLRVMLASVARTLHVGLARGLLLRSRHRALPQARDHPRSHSRSRRCASRPAVPTPASPPATGQLGNARPMMPGHCCANDVCPIFNAMHSPPRSTGSLP